MNKEMGEKGEGVEERTRSQEKERDEEDMEYMRNILERRE